MRVASILPLPVKNALAKAATVGFLSDWRSIRAYQALQRQPRQSPPVQVRIRQLGHADIELRPATTDARTAFSTFWHQFHLPPAEVTMPAAPIFLDLGANNGLTAAHLAALYPTARIVAVELDERNADIARRNTRPWVDRCTIMHAGVWFEDGELSYPYAAGREDAFGIGKLPSPGARMIAVRACPIDTIIALAGNPVAIDYVKMDIEGAEREVLRYNTGWLRRVRSIKVELHRYSHAECIADLEAAGMTARSDTHHKSCVVGINPSLT